MFAPVGRQQIHRASAVQLVQDFVHRLNHATPKSEGYTQAGKRLKTPGLRVRKPFKSPETGESFRVARLTWILLCQCASNYVSSGGQIIAKLFGLLQTVLTNMIDPFPCNTFQNVRVCVSLCVCVCVCVCLCQRDTRGSLFSTIPILVTDTICARRPLCVQFSPKHKRRPEKARRGKISAWSHVLTTLPTPQTLKCPSPFGRVLCKSIGGRVRGRARRAQAGAGPVLCWTGSLQRF